MKILFYDDKLVYDGNTLEAEPLGGSESALIYLTTALAEHGHDVHVYNKCRNPGIFNGVNYHKLDSSPTDPPSVIYEQMQYAMEYVKFDAFISLRTFHPFKYFLNSDLNVYWAQDDQLQPAMQVLKHDSQIRDNIDYIFAISKWQAWTYHRWFNLPKSKIYITRNGIDRDTYAKEPVFPKGKKLIYTSTPLRGLDILLDVFPRIREAVPDVTLDVYSSLLVYQTAEKHEKEQCAAIFKKLEQPGVVTHGSVTKKELSRALYDSRILAYPNTFAETGCIAAMEALAAGNVVVSSAQGALPETCQTGGILLGGVPYTKEYQDAFVETCIKALNDNTLCEKHGMEGRHRIFSQNTWDKIACEWEEMINRLLKRKYSFSCGGYITS